MEEVKLLLDRLKLPHVLQFYESILEDMFVEKNAHAPPFRILCLAFMLSTTCDFSQIDRDGIVNQHLLYCVVLLHNSFDSEEAFIVHGLSFILLIIVMDVIKLIVFIFLEILHICEIEVNL